MLRIAASTTEGVYLGLIDLVPLQGETVTLDGFSAAGLDDVQATAFVLDRSVTGGGGIGAMRDSEMTADAELQGLLAALVPLRGFSVKPTDALQVVLFITASSPAVAAFDSISLTYTIGGRSGSQTFDAGARVCFVVERVPGTTCSVE